MKMTNTVSKVQVQAFIDAVQLIVDVAYIDNPSDPKVSFSTGRFYTRIIREGSVYCFIDMRDGDIMSAASWKTPNKRSKGRRGNINDDNAGLEFCNEYGVATLR